MELVLYRRLHSDGGLARLLFEAKTDARCACGEGHDFYLYVWVRDGSSVAGFQVLLDDSKALLWEEGRGTTVGHVTDVPFNRAIAPGLSDQERHAIQDALAQVRSADLPLMVAAIARTWRESLTQGIPLNRDEQSFVAGIPADL